MNQIKRIASTIWETPDIANILGNVFHPGHLKLTARIADIAQINRNSIVLDIACGQGASACFLSLQYGCYVVGIDLSTKLIHQAQSKARADRILHRVNFIIGDGESLPFRDSAFDVVISECSFSLFPNKEIVAKEIKRVLKLGGKLVFSDVFLRGNITEQLRGSKSFAICIAGAMTMEDYEKLLRQVGFEKFYIEDRSIELKRLAYWILLNYGSVEGFLTRLTGDDILTLSTSWRRLFQEGKPGYALFAATKAQE